MRLIGGLTLAMLLTLTACTGDDDTPDDPTERDTTVAEPAWTLDLDVFTNPVAADGVAVVLVRDDDRLEIVAVDAETGEQLWSHPWSPGGVPTGFELRPSLHEGSDGASVAVFATPADHPELEAAWATPIVGVDLRTGEELWRTEPVIFSTPIDHCADGLDACYDPQNGATQRIDVTDGSTSDAGEGADEQARNIADGGLFSTDDRPGEELGVRRDGATLWSTDIAELLGVEGITTDNGWNFIHTDDPDMFVGSMSLPLGEEREALLSSGRPLDIGADESVMVAFEGDTGTVLWREENVTISCLGGAIRVDDEQPRLRCRPGGTYHYDAEATREDEMDDPSLTVEGFDPMSGETTWSIELPTDAAADILLNKADRPISDGVTVVLPSDDGPRLVVVETGKTRATDETDVFACHGETQTIEYYLARRTSNGESYSRYGADLLTPCHADGSAADAFSVAAVAEAGADAGKGHHVIAREGRLEGYLVK